MKEVYLVVNSFGEWDEYREVNDANVYLNLEDAEKRKKEIEDESNIIDPFPLNWCTEEEFEELLQNDKINNEDYEIYNRWSYEKYHKYSFNCCRIETLEVK